MNPTIIKLAQLVAKRPGDTTIRLLHIVTGLAIIGLLFWSRGKAVIDIPFYRELSPEASLVMMYYLMIVALFFLGRGLITACLIKHTLLRWKQGISGLLLIIIGGPMMDPVMSTQSSSANGFGISGAALEVASWHPGVFLVLMWILWIFVGLTGKGTTSKCLRYGEVIKKVRV